MGIHKIKKKRRYKIDANTDNNILVYYGHNEVPVFFKTHCLP
jgi:hypothetical protein